MSFEKRGKEGRRGVEDGRRAKPLAKPLASGGAVFERLDVLESEVRAKTLLAFASSEAGLKLE